MELFLSKIHSVQHILFSLKLNYKPLANEFLHFQANMTCQNHIHSQFQGPSYT